MNRFYILIFICVIGLSGLTVAHCSEREFLFNQSWKFYLGTPIGADEPTFDDSDWRTLDLPHDWSIEPLPCQVPDMVVGPFSRLSETRYPIQEQMGGGGWDVGYTMGGEGWYRNSFTLDISDVDKHITLYVEAASAQSEIWINGSKVARSHHAYAPFRVDITKNLYAPGRKNVIAIKVVNEGHNSRWYVGSGLFRNVWLIKTPSEHLDKWDTYIETTKLMKRQAEIRLTTTIRNASSMAGEGKFTFCVFDALGNEVHRIDQPTRLSEGTFVDLAFILKKPHLWSVDNPYLYRAVLMLKQPGGELLDQITIPFGIRKLDFSATKGFLLNNQPMELKGCCIHHDNGLLGAVSIPRAEEKRIELLKQNGFNAVRCSHNLASENFLAACDRLGMLVIHETFDQWFMPKRPNDYHSIYKMQSQSDLETAIRRDRNHPSIIMWSIGNEIPGRITQEGMAEAERLHTIVRSLDTTRPVTAGICGWDHRHYDWKEMSDKAFRSLDVGGYNYLHHQYEPDHIAYPNRIIFGSESFPKEAAVNWNYVERLPYVIGDFVWTGIDYVGEAGLAHSSLELSDNERNTQFMGWPWYNSWCGDLDIIGEKKPQSYYRDIVWRQRPIAIAVHAPLPIGVEKEEVNGWGWPCERQSWTWPGFEGKTMQVNVYSRSPRVQLYLNGQLIGEQSTDPECYTATFSVPYVPGCLVARNVGKEKSEVTLTTVGKAIGLRLVADRTQLQASTTDLSYIRVEVVDSEGRVLPDAALPLSIRVEGKGRLIAAGNGAYKDMKSFRSNSPDTFRGKALAIVQPTGEEGEILVKVICPGMKEAVARITVNK